MVLQGLRARAVDGGSSVTEVTPWLARRQNHDIQPVIGPQ